jgi:hypothetical protein
LRQVVSGLSDCLEKVIVLPFCHQESEIKISPEQKEIFFSEFLNLACNDPEKVSGKIKIRGLETNVLR